MNSPLVVVRKFARAALLRGAGLFAALLFAAGFAGGLAGEGLGAGNVAHAQQTPTPPLHPAFTSGPGVIIATWQPPDSPRGTITAYIIYATSDDNPLITVGGDARTATITGLPQTPPPPDPYNGQYAMWIKAVNAQGAGGSSGAQLARVGAVTAPAAPSASAAPTPAGVSPAKVTVSWSANSNNGSPITAYIFSYGAVLATLAASQTVSVVDVSLDVAYRFSVRAVNAIGTSPAAVATASISAPKPFISTFLAYTPAGDSRNVTLQWWKNDNGSPITAFYLSYGTITITLPGSASVTVISLAAGNYTFTLRAANANGVGPAAATAVSLAPVATAPGKPRNVRAAEVGDGFVVLAWDEPASWGGSTLSVYRAIFRSPGGQWASFSAGDTADTRITQNSNLTNGNAYHFHVFAQSQAGLWSENISSVIADSGFVPTVTATPVAAPPLSAVRNVAMATGSLSFAVSWDEPASWGGSSKDYYLLAFRNSSNGSDQQNVSTEGVTVNSHFNAPLVAGEGYYVVIWARSQAGEWSDSVRFPATGFVTAVASVAAPPAAAPSVSFATVTALASGTEISVSLSVADGGSSLTGLTLLYGGTAALSLSPSARATVIGGLSPSSAYTLSIVAVNAAGAATAVATATTPAQPITNPTAPRNIVATPGDGFLIFTWDEPASWGGSTLSVYQLFFGPVGQAFTPYGTPTVASLSVGSLTNGNQYRFRVRARSQANKNGPYAPIVTAIPAAPATAPSAPRNLSGTPLPASFRLSWSAPLNDGGASVTAYIIYVSPDAVLTVSGDVLTATVTGLTPGVALVFWVRARNSAGDSGNSNFASGSPLPLPATNPDKPRNVRAVEVGDGFVVIAWDEPASWGGSTMSLYRPYYREVADSWSRVNNTDVTVYAASYTLTQSGLQNGVAYEFHVVAQSRANLWSESFTDLLQLNFVATLTATPAPPAPTQPSTVRNIVAVTGSLSFVISWDEPADWGNSTLSIYRMGWRDSNDNTHIVETADNRVTLSTHHHGGSNQTPLVAGNNYYMLIGARSQANLDSSYIRFPASGFLTAVASVAAPPPAATAPSAPSVFAAAAPATATAATAQVTLSWSAPANGGAPLTAYILSYGAVSTNLLASQTATVVGVSVGVGYVFSLRAANSVGASPAAVVSASVAAAAAPPPSGVPGLPVLHHLLYSQGHLNVSPWVRPPENDGGSPVTDIYGYFVDEDNLGGENVHFEVDSNTNYPLRIADGNFAIYIEGADTAVSIWARNANGVGPTLVVPIFNSIFNEGAETAPSVPRNLRARALANNSVVISWRVPETNNGKALTRYEINYGGTIALNVNTATRRIVSFGSNYDIPVFEQSVTVSVAATVSRGISIRARNSEGLSPAAVATAAAYVPPQPPAAPTTFAAAATPNGVSPAQVTLSWSAPAAGDAPITAYLLSYGTVSAVLPASARQSVVGVSFGVSYAFTLRAANANGASPAAVASVAAINAIDADVPGAPVLHHVWNNGVGLYYVYAQPPDDDGGSPISVIVASFSDSNSAFNPGGAPYTWRIAVSANTDYPIQIQDFYPYIYLSEGETALTLWAENAIGAGATAVYSPISRNDGPPTAPRNVRANAASGEITVSWRVPWYMGVGSGATFFDNYFIDYGTATLTVSVVANVRDEGRNIGAFEQTVVITTDTSAPRGISVWTNNNSDDSPVAAVTTQAGPAAPVVVSLSAAVATISPPRIALEWALNAMPSATAVYIHYAGMTATLPGGATQTIIAVSAAGVNYAFSVRAANAIGLGAAVVASAVVPAAPSAPAQFVAQGANASLGVSLSWLPPSVNANFVTAYIVEFYDNGLNTFAARPGDAALAATASAAFVTGGFVAGRAERLRLRALWAGGQGAPSAEALATLAIPPAAPQSVSIGIGRFALTLFWSPVTAAAAGGASVTAFVAAASYSGGGQTLTVSGADTSAVVAGLQPGATVAYFVRPVNLAGAGAQTGGTATLLAAGAPAAPHNFFAGGIGPGSVILRWQPPADEGALPVGGATTAITGYILTYAGSVSLDLDAGARQYSVTGLAENSTVAFTLRAVNHLSVGAAAAATATAGARPGPPVFLQIVPSDLADEMVIRWNPPAFLGGVSVHHYIASGGGSSVSVRGNAPLVATLAPLPLGQIHVFTLMAHNTSGGGDPAVRAVYVPPAAVPPGQLQELYAAPAGADALLLTWILGANGGAPIISLEVKSTAGVTIALVQDGGYTLTGLAEGETAAVSARPINRVGAGVWKVAYAAPRPVLPGAPQNFQISNAAATAHWNAPANDGGADIIRYLLVYNDATVSVSAAIGVGGVYAYAYPQSLAVQSNINVFALRAQNSIGVGPPAFATAFVANPNVLPPPVSVEILPGPNQVRLRWQPSPFSVTGVALAGYIVYAGVAGGVAGLAQTYSVPAGQAQYDVVFSHNTNNGRPGQRGLGIGGVWNGRALFWQVASYSGNFGLLGWAPGARSAPVTVTPLGPPAPANNYAVITVESTRAAFRWTPPTPANHPHRFVTHGYELRYGGVSVTVWGVNANSVTLFNLAPNTQYAVTIFSFNNAHAYGPTYTGTPRSLPISTAAPSAPYAPRDFGFEDLLLGGGEYRIGWLPPVDNGGSPITQYKIVLPTVTLQLPAQGAGITLRHFATVTFALLDDATPVSILAVNANGDGRALAASVAPPAPPLAPANFAGAPNPGQNYANLSWTDAVSPGTPLLRYVLEYSAMQGGALAAQTAVILSPFSRVFNLPNAASVAFTLRAINRLGEGPPATLTVNMQGAPNAPTALQAAQAVASLVVSWNAAKNNGLPVLGHTLRFYAANFAGHTATAGAATVAAVNIFNALGGVTAYGKVFTVSVFARNAAGAGAAAGAAVSISPPPPGAPLSLRAIAGDGLAHLFWSPPSVTAGAGAPLQYVAQAGAALYTISASAPKQVAIHGLANGALATLSLWAANNAGAGPATAIVASPQAPNTIEISEPTNLGFVGSFETQYVFSWDHPTLRGGLVSRYLSEYKRANSSVWLYLSDGDRDNRAIPLPGLPYNFGEGVDLRVRASAFVNGQFVISDYATLSVSPLPINPELMSQIAYDGGVGVSYDDAAITIVWRPHPASVSVLANGGAPIDKIYINGLRVDAGKYNGPPVPNGNAPVLAADEYMILPVASDQGQRTVVLRAGMTITAVSYAGVPNGVVTSALPTRVFVFNPVLGAPYRVAEARIANEIGLRSPLFTSGQADVEFYFTRPADAPANLRAVARGNGVSLYWNRPPNSGGAERWTHNTINHPPTPGIFRYVVRYRPAAGGAWQTRDFFSDNDPGGSVYIAGLQASVEYEFAVFARSSVYKDSFSSLHEYAGATAAVRATPIMPALPGAPSEFIANGYYDNVQLSWRPPTDDGGVNVSDYILEYGAPNFDTPDAAQTLAVTLTAFNIGGLTPQTAYEFRLRAQNTVGAGVPTIALATTRFREEADPPSNVVAQEGDGFIGLSWQPPINDGGDTITAYIGSYVSAAGSVGVVAVGGNASSLRFVGLQNGVVHTISIYADNGQAGEAATVFATPGRPPEAPQNVSVAFGDAALTLHWAAPITNNGASITAYSISYRSAATGEAVAVVVNGLAATLSAGLQNGVLQLVSVRALNRFGAGSVAVVSSIPVQLPSPPTGFVARGGDRQVNLQWRAPANTGGVNVPILAYVLALNGSVVATTSAQNYTLVANLQNNRLYTVAARAQNTLGLGAPATATVTPRANPPAGVQGLVADFADGVISLHWQLPLFDGGATITAYTVQYRIGGGAPAGLHLAGISATAASVSAANGVLVVFGVAAINSVGAGETVTISQYASAAPGAPSGFVAVNYGDAASIHWSAPAVNGGDAVTAYQLSYYSHADSAVTQTVYALSAGEAAANFAWRAVRGLLLSRAYGFTLQALNRNGAGDAATQQINTQVTAPSALRNVAINYNGIGGIRAEPHTVTQEGITVYIPNPNLLQTEYLVFAYPEFSGGGDDFVFRHARTPINRISMNWEVVRNPAASFNQRNDFALRTQSFNPADVELPGQNFLADGTSPLAYSWFSNIDDPENMQCQTNVPIRVWAHNGRGGGDGPPVTVMLYSEPAEEYRFWDLNLTNPLTGNPGWWGTVTVGLPAGPSSLRVVSVDNNSAMLAITRQTEHNAPAARAGIVYGCNYTGETSSAAGAQAEVNDNLQINGYHLYYRTQGEARREKPVGEDPAYIAADTPAKFAAVAPTLTVMLDGLVNGQVYTVSALARLNYAETSFRQSRPSPTVVFTVFGEPEAPNLGSYADGDGHFSVSWTNNDDGGKPITAYVIRHNGVSAVFAAADLGVSGVISASVSVANGVPLSIDLYALNEIGEGDAVAFTLTAAGVPAAPQNLTQYLTNINFVGVSFDAPTANNGATITQYIVYYTNSTAVTTAFVSPAAAASAYSLTLTNLVADASVGVSVFAQNRKGQSPALVGAVTAKSTAPAAAPTILSITIGSGAATIRFAAVSAEFNGGATIVDYILRYWQSATNTLTATAAASASSITIGGLQNGVSTTLSFAARNANGEGPATVTVAFPSGPPIVPPSFAVTDPQDLSKSGELVLEWTMPTDDGGAPITGYDIEYHAPGAALATIKQLGAETLKTTVSALINGNVVAFTLYAKNEKGRSPSISNSGTPKAAPDAPVAITATPQNAAVSLAWQAPTVVVTNGVDRPGNNGAPITAYSVSWQPAAGENLPEAVAGSQNVGDVLAAVITGLANGARYAFSVRALNARGAGAYSSLALAQPARAPHLPSNVAAAVNTQNGVVTLSFNAPSNNGGSAITGYVAYYAVPGQSLVLAGRSTASPIMVTAGGGWQKGAGVSLYVAADNGFGVGSVAAVANLVTAFSKPSAPLAVTVISANGSVTVRWQMPADDGGASLARIDFYYDLHYNHGGVADSVEGVTTTAAVIDNLTNGNNITVSAQAYFAARDSNNAAQEERGAFSAPAVGQPRGAPLAPQSLAFTSGDTTIMLSWSAPASDGGFALAGYDLLYGNVSQTLAANATAVEIGGQTNGEDVTLTLRAKNSFGAGAPAVITAFSHGKPDAPANLRATGIDNAILLQWQPPNNRGAAITAYVFESNGQSTVASADARQITIAFGFSNGTEYAVTAYAENALGRSGGSVVSATPVDRPSQPTSLSVARGNGLVTLQWRAPASDGGNAIMQYVVSTQINNTAHVELVPASNHQDGLFALTITGLQNGETYNFAVLASNALTIGEAALTNAKPATTPQVAPTNAAAGFANESITLSWQAVPAGASNNGGEPVTAYAVYYNGGSITVYNATSTVVGGLTNGVSYLFSIYAINAVGRGSLFVTVGEVPSAPPSAPQGFTVTPVDGGVTLAWQAPANDNGATIANYAIGWDGGGPAFSGNTIVAANATLLTQGLENGRTYTISIYAVNRAGNGAAAAATVKPAGKPDAPSLQLTDGNSVIVATWNTPNANGDAISLYLLRWSGDGASGNITAAASPVTLTGLTNGEEYAIAVRASNKAGLGAESNEERATPATTPIAPGGFTAAPGAGQVTLSWNRYFGFVTNGGADVTAYIVSWVASTTTVGGSYTIAAALSHVVTGLANGTLYNLSVRALNRKGPGDWTASRAATPIAAPQAPSLQVGETDGSVTIWFDEPNDNGADILRYVLQHVGGGIAGNTITILPSEPRSLSLSVVNGIALTVNAVAINSVGTSSLALLTAFGRGAPGVVTSLTVIPGNEQLEFKWGAPTNDGGGTITNYIVRWNLQPDGFFNINVTNGLMLSRFVDAVDNSTAITFAVAAQNQYGTSENVTIIGVPVAIPDEPTSLSVARGDTVVTLQWGDAEPNGATISAYAVLWAEQGQGDIPSWSADMSANIAKLTAGATYRHTITGLTNGITYDIAVMALSDLGDGLQTITSARPAIAPIASPQAFSVATGETNATLSWLPLSNAAAANGGEPITAYVVSYLVSGQILSRSFAVSDPAATARITQNISPLNTGDTYHFSLFAQNAVGLGPVTVVDGLVAGPPGAPVSVSAVFGNTAVTLSWAPSPANGSAVTVYILQYSHDGQARAITMQPANLLSVNGRFTFTITGLTNGTAYRFTLYARNERPNNGQPFVTNVTPATHPNAPANLTADFEYDSVLLNWRQPNGNGDDVDEYLITWQETGVAGVTLLTITSSQSSVDATVASLANGKDYNISVFAVNKAGRSANAATTSGRAAGSPAAPAGFQAASGNEGVTLSWNHPHNGGAALTGYILIYNNLTRALPATATQTVIAGLTSGTAYSFVLYALNNTEDDGLRATVTATEAGAPASPTGLIAAHGNTSVVLSWNFAADDNHAQTGGSEVTAYLVRYGANMAATINVASHTAVSVSIAITGLANGEDFDFSVFAQNSVGQSSPAIIRERANTTPGAPSLSFASDGDGVVVVRLQPMQPINDGGHPITVYQLQYTGGNALTVSAPANAPVLATITGLTNGSPITISALAQNRSGNGPLSAPITATAATTPAAPTGLIAGEGIGTITLQWSALAPANNGGAAVQNYVVYVDGVASITTTATAYTLTNATNGVTVAFAVRAQNRKGEGAPATLRAAARGAPDAVEGLYSEGTSVAISLIWREPSGNGRPVTRYQIEYNGQTSHVDAPETSFTLTGLSENQEVVFTVRAENSVSLGAALTITGTARAAPAAPTGLTAQRGNREITVSWNAIPTESLNDAELYGYFVVYNNAIVSVGPNVTSYTLTALQNGRVYNIQVFADSSLGNGTRAVTMATPATTPSAPIVTAQPRPESAILVIAVTNNGGEPVTAYAVQWTGSGNGASDGSTIFATVGNPATVTVLNLANGGVYRFRAIAHNAVGASDQGNYSDAVTPADAPATPTNLAAQSGDRLATLTWNPPNDGGSPITAYIVEWQENGVTFSVRFAANNGTRRYVLQNLNNGIAYNLSLRAINAVGAGDASNVATANPVGPPNPVQNLRVTQDNIDSVILRWDAPVSNAGSPVLGYQVRRDHNNGGEVANLSGENNRAVTITMNIPAGARRVFVVRATNNLGAGAGATISVTAAGVASAPRNFTVLQRGDGEITFRWDSPSNTGGANVTAYALTYEGVSIRSHNTRATATGLTNTKTYSFTLRAINRKGESAAAVLMTNSRGVPGSVTNLVASPGHEKVDLSWDAGDPNGAPITRYYVEYSGGTRNYLASQRAVIIDNLENGVEYTFKVYGQNEAGPGATATIKATPEGVPDAPTVYARFGNMAVTLTWRLPTDNGSSITAFVLMYRGMSVDYPTTKTGHTVTGLVNGETYSFTVNTRATLLSSGEERYGSPTVVSATPARAPDAPTLRSQTLTARGDGYVFLSWLAQTATLGASVSHYEVAYKPGANGAATTVRVNDGAATSVYVRNLQNGTEYFLSIRAFNRAGASDWSNEVKNRPARAPDAPRGVRAQPGADGITILWQPPNDDGGEPVIRYIVEYDTTVNGPTTAITVAADTRLTYSITLPSLAAAGERYRVEVFAANIVGTSGAASDISEAEIVAKAIGPQLVGVLLQDWTDMLEARAQRGGRDEEGEGGGASFSIMGANYRFGGKGGGNSERLQRQAAGLLQNYGKGMGGDGFDIKSKLREAEFEIGGLGAGGAGKGAGMGAGGGGAGKLGVWGRATYRSMQETGGEITWDGASRGFYLGADYPVYDNLVVGAMFSRNNAKVDYEREGGRGEYELELTGAHPYLFWDATPQTRLWLSGGRGKGTSKTTGETGETAEADVKVDQFSGGFEQGLYVWSHGASGATRLSFEAAAALGKAEFGAVNANVRNYNAALKAERSHRLAGGDVLATHVKAGWRNMSQSGNANAHGLQTRAGVSYRSASGWLWELSAGALQLRGDGKKYNEWSASGLLRKDAAANGGGLYVKFAPRYAPVKSRAMPADSWQALSANFADAEYAAGAEAELGYGAFRAGGLWTPFVGVDYKPQNSDLRLGLRWQHRAVSSVLLRGLMETKRSQSGDNQLNIRLRADY